MSDRAVRKPPEPPPEGAPGPGDDLATRLMKAAPRTLAQAVEQMSLGLTLSDPEGRIVYANRAEAAMHGYPPEDLIGRPASELGAPGEAVPPPPDALAEVPWGRSRLNRRRDGTTFPVRLVSDDVRDEAGRVLGRITVSEDVTERARLDRMKEEFVRVVSHELRTPLTSIVGALGLLRGGAAPGSRAERAVEVAERNARHLLAVVRSLLDLERAVSGALELDLRPVPVAEVLEEAARRAGEESGRVAVELSGLGGGPAAVRADRERLLEVLGQLLSNALKFSPPSSLVRLEGRRGPRRTTLEVIDHGSGIPARFRHRLFEPFLQADASTTRPASGAGLGLALARALAEGMGGELELAAAATSGTTLRLHLPNA
jgi:PAS domain S-box-containing protein